MARTIVCPADEWTVIFDHAFVQLPWSWDVSFVANDGDTVAGEVVIVRSQWVFPQPPISMPLTATMQFTRGYWNTFYQVRVRPTGNVVARIA